MDTNTRLSRILYADDNIQLGSVLQIGLRTYGMEVLTACNGVDALKQFKANTGDFSAIVTDHDMPQMNGHELVRSLRALGFNGRIVVVSSCLSAEELLEYQTHAISGFLQMPFNLAALATMLLLDNPVGGAVAASRYQGEA